VRLNASTELISGCGASRAGVARRGTDGSQTLRWREMDSISRGREDPNYLNNL